MTETRTVYFDCFSGASGDMLLGGLVDAASDRDAMVEAVRGAVGALGVEGWELDFDRVMRGPISALKARVVAAEGKVHRNLADIEALIGAADLDERVGSIARDTFRALARAEAKVHGTTVEQVHFHEVGALDAIVDIVGAAAALTALGPARVVASPLALGRGVTTSDHGDLPVPGPAVLDLVSGVPVVTGGEGELLTPTGAAFLVTVADGFGEMPAMTLERVGVGAGDRDGKDLPNVLRVLVGRGFGGLVGGFGMGGAGGLVVVECNLDDMAPELIPYAIERLLASGAHDAWTTPIVMKKGRPAVTLSVLVGRDELQQVLDVLYAETTTLGVRIAPTGKDFLERRWETVEVDGYEVRLKLGLRGGAVVNVAVEHDDAAKVARITGMPLKEVYRRALQERL